MNLADEWADAESRAFEGSARLLRECHYAAASTSPIEKQRFFDTRGPAPRRGCKMAFASRALNHLDSDSNAKTGLQSLALSPALSMRLCELSDFYVEVLGYDKFKEWGKG